MKRGFLLRCTHRPIQDLLYFACDPWPWGSVQLASLAARFDPRDLIYPFREQVDLCWPDPQGREAVRAAPVGSEQVGVHHQSQNRQGTRHHRAASGKRAGR